jgi:hypothetical protein
VGHHVRQATPFLKEKYCYWFLLFYVLIEEHLIRIAYFLKGLVSIVKLVGISIC